MNRILLVLLIATLMGSLPCVADIDTELTQAISDLTSEDTTNMLKAKVALKRIRPRLVMACKEILNDQDKDKRYEQWVQRQSVRNAAIEILGDLRAEEAVDLLIENLSPPPSVPRTSWPFKGYPPAIEALAKIGKPATAKLMKAIVDTTEQDTIRGLGLALIHIEGFAGGKELLESAIRSEGDKKRRTRLQAAHVRYMKLPKTLPPPGYDD